MTKELLTPDYIFESSWEVCNKVGGIYTVLSTRANTLQARFHDRLFFIGPDFWQGKENPLFIESDNLCAAWKKHAFTKDNLSVRIGRWNIPGNPIVILVDFQPFFAQKNEIYTEMWNHYQVDSLHAYGDYDEASMFSYAAGKVVESFYRYNLTETDKVVYQAHEWMTGMGALYLQIAVPEIATIFTTHATSIGRSIAGNNKPLYDYLFAYNGDQMAEELNMNATVCALSGGEDYELLFTAPLEHYDLLTAMPGISVIGHTCKASEGCYMTTRDGNTFELKAQGWQNFSSTTAAGESENKKAKEDR